MYYIDNETRGAKLLSNKTALWAGGKTMKSPKYILFTDHFAGADTCDRHIAIKAKTFLEAFDTAIRYLDDDVFMIYIYERVPNTHGKKYMRVALLRSSKVLERKIEETFTNITDMGIIINEA